MDNQVVIVVATGVIVVLGYLAVRSLGDQMRGAVAQMQQNVDLDTTSISAEDPSDLRATVESLSMRFEQLHEECLRYVRKGSSSLQRARRLNGDDDLDDDDDGGEEMQQLVFPEESQVHPPPGPPLSPIAFRLQRQAQKKVRNGT